MPTIGEIYNPLIEAVKIDSPKGHEMLSEVGYKIFLANKDKCPSHEDGIEAAKKNLDYYCQYFDSEIANKVKKYYNLGGGFRTVTNVKTDIPI